MWRVLWDRDCLYFGFDCADTNIFKGWGGLARAGENVAGLRIGTDIRGTPNQPGDVDEGYSVEIAVPFRELPTYTRGNRPEAGDRLNVMLVWLDRYAEKGMDVYGFQPLLSWGHNIWNHAPLELVKR